MVKKVVDIKNPILRQKAKPVAKIDKKIRQLIQDMQDTLEVQKDPEGVGLAAPQLGKNLRIFVVDYRKDKKIIINPEILEVSETPKTKRKNLPAGRQGKNQILEGCLSLPYYYGPIKRSTRIKIKYQNIDGKEKTEEFSGFLAQIMQHEIDHLNGILFIDRIIEQKSPLYKFKGEDDWEEVDI